MGSTCSLARGANGFEDLTGHAAQIHLDDGAKPLAAEERERRHARHGGFRGLWPGADRSLVGFMTSDKQGEPPKRFVRGETCSRLQLKSLRAVVVRLL